MKERLIGYAAALLAVSMLAGHGTPTTGTGAAINPGSRSGASQPGASQAGGSQAGTPQIDGSQIDVFQNARVEGASIAF